MLLTCLVVKGRGLDGQSFEVWLLTATEAANLAQQMTAQASVGGDMVLSVRQVCFEVSMSLDMEGRLLLQPKEAELTAAVCSCIDGIIGIACSLPRPLTTRTYAHFFDNKPASAPLEAIIRQLCSLHHSSHP